MGCGTKRFKRPADKVVVPHNSKDASTTEMELFLEFDADTLAFKKRIVIPVSGDEEEMEE